MEMPAEALLVGQARHSHHHRIAVLAGGEELQAGRLAPELIFGVVQVGEVLDLRYRKQPGGPGTESEPEDRLLVEQRVEDPAGAEPAGQPASDSVDPALAPDVLAEDQEVRVRDQRVGQTAVDAVREGERSPGLGQPAAERILARSRVARAGRAPRDVIGTARRERGHDLLAAGQTPAGYGFLSKRTNAPAHGLVPVQ